MIYKKKSKDKLMISETSQDIPTQTFSFNPEIEESVALDINKRNTVEGSDNISSNTTMLVKEYYESKKIVEIDQIFDKDMNVEKNAITVIKPFSSKDTTGDKNLDKHRHSTSSS